MSQDIHYPSIYDHTVNDRHGNPVALSKYKGKVCVIVNISCKSPKAERNLKNLYISCGALHGLGVKLLLFPCYQFGEVEDFSEVSEFVQKNCHGIPELFEPIDVNGPNAASLYQFLKSKKQNDVDGNIISGSYTAFVINTKGLPIERFNSGFSIDDIRDAINSCTTRDLQYRYI